MRFEVKEGVTDFKTIKVSLNNIDGNICKEELPIYTNNSLSESLILLLGEILAMQERFEWLVEGGVGNNGADKKKAHLLVF